MKNFELKKVVKGIISFCFLFLSLGIFAQEKTVEGVVTSPDGLPLPGVTVVQKGTSNGVVTDFDGNFRISLVQEEPNILLFSYVGFETLEMNVENQSVLSVSLVEDSEALDAVVVVGYGTARRKNITGAISTVDLENSPVANIPSSNPLQSLQGRASGLNISPQTSPGSTPGILIRGQNSINGNNDPLIVLDGIIYLGSLQNIDPSTISKFDILKDASAAAAYGSRAANGVIIITTKKGETGEPTIKFSSTIGINTWNNKFDMMNLTEYEQKYAAQMGFEVDEIIFDDETRNVLLEQRVDTDWMDLISRNGIILKEQVSVSGRTEKVNYFISGGYDKEEGVIIGDDFKRISFLMKVDTDITDWLEVGINGTYNNNDYSGIGANMSQAYDNAPIGYPYRFEGMPFNVDSAVSEGLERYPTGSSVQSPLWGTDGTIEDINKSDFFRFAGYALLKIPQISGLSYRFNYSVNAHYDTQDRFYFENYYVGMQGPGEYFERYSPEALQTRLSQANGSNSRTNGYSYVMDNILNYNKEFGDHYLDATLVATRDYTYDKNLYLFGSDFSSNGNTVLGVNGLHKANVIQSSLDVVERSNIGYLARIGYTYQDKYHLNASVRRDGASVFGVGNKWGNFPSIGLAWTISEENFSNNISFLDYLKVNASYGKNGNQGVESYSTLSRAASGYDGGIRYEFGDEPSKILYGVQLASLANPNLGWETTSSFNAGFQSRFFNNRISLDLDFYFSKTTDQIFVRRIPIMTGFESIIASLGQVNNHGIEIGLSSTNITTEDFNWSSNLNFWKNRNRLVSLYGDDLDGDGVEDDDIANGLFIGESLGSIYGYEYIGIVQEDDTDYISNTAASPGDAKFRDLNGDGLITAADRRILGNRKENFRLSLSNTVDYKNFSFYVLVSGIFGGGEDNFLMSENPLHNSFSDRFDTNEISHPWWTPENASETYLRPNYIGTRYLGLQSRTFVRIQDLSLSYSITGALLDQIGVSSFQLFSSIRNAYTFTNWFGDGDPEIGIRPGEDIYPVPTTYSAGLNVSF